jgi:hypothetical protein
VEGWIESPSINICWNRVLTFEENVLVDDRKYTGQDMLGKSTLVNSAIIVIIVGISEFNDTNIFITLPQTIITLIERHNLHLMLQRYYENISH